MKPMHKIIIACATALAAQVPVAQAAADGAYPQEPVKLIVSYAAGNVTDLVGRMIAEQLSRDWHQPVIVENRPGAGGSLGAGLVAKARPDGQTLLFSAVAALAVNPHIYKHVNYDSLKDFSYISLAVAMPLVCVVRTDSPIKDFRSLIAYSQSHPGAVNYGSAGSGTISHLSLEMLKSKFGLNATHVPYKSSAAVMTDLLGGRIQIGCEPATVTMPLVRSGKLRAIGITSAKPMPSLPQIATVASQLGSFSSGAWLGLLAPRGTPAPIVEKINADMQKMLKDPTFQSKMGELGIEVLGEGPQGFAARLRSDYQQYGEITQRLGMKVD
jgi:tripartite-type tricarboxylate transporter receptor subunit TctC